MTNLKLSSYIKEEEIQAKVKELGQAITKKFKGKDVVAICVLKGSFVFYSDLIRAVDTDLTCEFFGVSSYHGGTSSSGEVKVTLDLANPVEGKHVILVEDIVDTGLTMNYLKTAIMSRKPKSLTTIALLEKPDALKVPCEIDMVGFKIPNDFVVGYGLDYQGFYRNLPYIAQVQNFN
ncbi:MAG: hypoxanthine phosphoribosyltransferase [Pseudobdellovibrionaceae bacterium]